MARISKSELTKLEIIQAATRSFLEHGYTNSSLKHISGELEMSTGNLTFYFPTKEHLLAALIDILCDFQWKMMEIEAQDGISSLLAICLEMTAMAVMCEEDPIAKDIYLSAYSQALPLEIIRKNDAKRAQAVFGEYRPEWNDEQFNEAEILVSGIEYATLMTTNPQVPLEKRICGAINQIMCIFNVPEDIRKVKLRKVMAMDYRKIGRTVLTKFKQYVEDVTEQAFLDLLKG